MKRTEDVGARRRFGMEGKAFDVGRKKRFNMGWKRHLDASPLGRARVRYMLVLLVVSFGMFLRFYDEKVNPCNSTALAFSYKYGFLPQGLVGTLYQLLNQIMPFHMMKYEAVMNFSLIATILFHLVLFYFFWLCLKRCQERHLQDLEYVILFCALLTISMFFSKRQFGRLDMYMLAFSLICAVAFVKGKGRWLAVPLSVLGMLVHQDYMFLYMNLVLVLLAYQALSVEGRARRTYWILAGVSLVAAVLLFFWFSWLFQRGLALRGDADSLCEAVAAMAKKLSYKGKYDETLIARELLGTDFSAQEWPLHVQNWIETPVFLLLVSPYIVLGVKLMRGILSQAKDKAAKWKYRIVAWGAFTILPLFVCKVDYGRWFFAVIIYYVIIVLTLVAMGDKVVEAQLFGLMARVRETYSWSMLLLLYAVLFMPFWDVHICGFLKNISNPIHEAFLHLW